jgi:hypothetical protein
MTPLERLATLALRLLRRVRLKRGSPVRRLPDGSYEWLGLQWVRVRV